MLMCGGAYRQAMVGTIALYDADGEHDNWDFLDKHTDKQTLDFYHAAEYLTDVAVVLYAKDPDKIFSRSAGGASTCLTRGTY